MKLQIEEGAHTKAVRGFAKILAVIIVLSVAALGDVMYIMEMNTAFKDNGVLLIFCYLGASTSFLAIGYILMGKSSVFAPGPQMLAAWIVFAMEMAIIALNIMLVFSGDKVTGFMAAWKMISPATPVMHMLGVAMVYFLDPELKEKHRDKELASKIRQSERDLYEAVEGAKIQIKRKHLEYTVRELEAAVNSPESQARIAQHATNMNEGLLTEMSGRSLPSGRIVEESSSEGYYGRR